MIVLAAIAVCWVLRRLLAPLVTLVLIAVAIVLITDPGPLAVPSLTPIARQLERHDNALSPEAIERLLGQLGLHPQLPPRPVCGTPGALPRPICQPAPHGPQEGD